MIGGRPLILGGVKIEYPNGLDGHSDADVLVHALMDALLGAAGLKDIGHFFPPGDPKYKGISSLLLLEEVRANLERMGYRLVNADTVIIAESPRLAPYIEEMKDKIAAALRVPPALISIKATTTEGLGVCGRGEAMAAQAVVLLEHCGLPDPE
jgi:2-C-methyl-D-erythritol 2,4-cyclodiphosphate synthase